MNPREPASARLDTEDFDSCGCSRAVELKKRVAPGSGSTCTSLPPSASWLNMTER